MDSVAALTPKVEIDGDMDDQQVGVQLRLMSKALKDNWTFKQNGLYSYIYQTNKNENWNDRIGSPRV